MHELSIAVSLVEVASKKASAAGAERISKVFLKLGPLSGVVRDALEFSFDVATSDTMLDGADLVIEEVPVVVYCPQCAEEKALLDEMRSFHACCPSCGIPTPDVRSGREMEVTALELDGG